MVPSQKKYFMMPQSICGQKRKQKFLTIRKKEEMLKKLKRAMSEQHLFEESHVGNSKSDLQVTFSPLPTLDELHEVSDLISDSLMSTVNTPAQM